MAVHKLPEHWIKYVNLKKSLFKIIILVLLVQKLFNNEVHRIPLLQFSTH